MMFKLLSLSLKNHVQLKDLEISFVEDGEIFNVEKPYTSVIIGSNGTGKSFILRTIIEIFREFHELKKGIKKTANISFYFQLKYQIENNVYEIITKRFAVATKKGLKREFLFFKNRPTEISLFANDDDGLLFEKKNGYEIDINDLPFPSRILASSVFLNDRFPFAESLENDFYQYLGVRRTANLASTKTFARNTVKYLYEASFKPTFKSSLAEILGFLEFEKTLTILYNTRYNKLFFTGDLTFQTFQTFYESWWELKDQGVNRNKDNSPWGTDFYHSLLKNKPERIQEIINFLNQNAKNTSRIQHKNNSKSKYFVVDFFNSQFQKQDFDCLEALEKLNILTLEQIKISKKNIEISVEETSSGEYHLILNILGIFAKIEESSLILIDEPEISLHPNWQMRYITFLKNVFARFCNCQFIITTHSHFLISDLQGSSSSVISLNREDKSLSAKLHKGQNTYGWSAEEILYSVFNVKTTRNYYLEYDLVKLVSLINKNSEDFEEIRRITTKLLELELNENDPLKIIIEKSSNYLADNNA